jgi:hypothetical protein
MNGTKYFEKPRSVLPRATGPGECIFTFGTRDLVADVKGTYYHFIGGILRKAVLSPGVRVTEYFEENGYEYETYAIYHPVDNTIHTNDIRCPNYCHHHLGSTCGVCGQEG